MRRLALLFIAATLSLTAAAQRSFDFAEKFLSRCKGDSTVKCVTISPKMLEQMLKQHEGDRNESLVQAIGKLKSVRIVTAHENYYQQAEDLLLKNSRRFKAEKDYRSEHDHGAFFTRKDKEGNTVELIMLHEDCNSQQLTIINLTGDIDEEFLCFLYNNKTFKN